MTAIATSWRRATIGELAELIRGVTYKKEQTSVSPAKGLVPLLRATNIAAKLLLETELVYVPKSVVSEKQMLLVGDIILAASSGSLAVVGKSAQLTSSWQGTFGAFCAVLRAREVDSRFLAYRIASPDIRKRWSAAASGTNINNLKRDDILLTEVAVPPIQEQLRIVEFLDEQFSCLDAAEVMLRKLAQKMKRRFFSMLFTRLRSESYKLTKLVDLVDILDSRRVPVNSKDRSGRSGTVPYYGATGQVGWIDRALFNEELTLLGEDGAPFLEPLREKAYVVSGPSWVNNHAHVLRARTKLITNRFLASALNCVDYRPFVNGTTRLKLTQAAMREIEIEVPTLDVQSQIIDEIEAEASTVRHLSSTLAETLQRAGALRRIVLEAAISGRLLAAAPPDATVAFLRSPDRVHDRSPRAGKIVVAT